ncbi:MAG: CPBP family glutamic-type intramembrane protease, partial [Sandaracinaceae bacterium]
PFTEESITRGILVVMLGHALGSAWLGIAVGLLVNVLVHIYQGRANLTYHVLFYAATVALLYSPVGLAGAIACHLAADLGALVFARRTLEQWRALASEERRLAIEAAG